MQDHQDLRNGFHCAANAKHPACNLARLDQKWRNFWKFSRKFWEFLIKISMENWLFSKFLAKYFLEFCLLSETIYPWKIKPDFYNNHSDFGSNVPAFPHPDASAVNRIQSRINKYQTKYQFISLPFCNLEDVGWAITESFGGFLWGNTDGL